MESRKPARRSVNIRLPEHIAEKAAALAASVAHVATYNRILAMAIEMGLDGVEAQLRAATTKGSNGVSHVALPPEDA
jgi:hypothetical protein